MIRSVVSPESSGTTDSAKPFARTRTTALFSVDSSSENRPSGPVSTVRAVLPPLSMATVAPAIGAPEASMTMPVVGLF